MKNISKIWATAVATASVMTACNDLNTVPEGQIVTSDQKEDVVAANPEMVSASVTGITALFYEYGNVDKANDRHSDFGYPALMLFSDARGTDMVTTDVGYNWFSGSLTYEDVDYKGFTTLSIWRTMYNQIYAANNVEKLISADVEDDLSKFYRAQALAIRAFDYFYLAQRYQFTYVGHENAPCVPIITNENAAAAATDGCPRATVDSVYSLICSDLNGAIALLTGNKHVRGDKRYVDLATAYGLRARVNLVMNKWAEAASDAQTAIDLTSATPYTMQQVSVPAFNNIDDNSWMWGIKVAETDRVVTTGICNFPSHMGSLNYGYATVGAWRMISPKLFGNIPASDVRRGWWLDENQTSVNLNAAYAAAAAGYGAPAYATVKFACYKDEPATSNNASDIPLMRVEEMYLILAEAQAMSGNPAEGKQTLVNFVQTYRDPQFSTPATEAIDIQKAVYNQRRIEFWGEGIIYNDIMRLNKGVDRRGYGFPEKYIFNIAADDCALLYRIPQSEIEANKLISEDENNPFVSVPEPVAE